MTEKGSLALARIDLSAFAAAVTPGFELPPHVGILVSVLEAVERGEDKRLIVAMPPRHGKSFLCSTLFPAWVLGRNPRRLVIGASHSQELADVFGRRVRNTLLDDRFLAIFPACRLSEDSAAASRFDTSLGGSYFGIGRGGGLTGRGADLVVIDDPTKDAQEASSLAIRQQLKEWYSAVVYTRLQPGGAVVVVSTRWHLDDLAGWLLREHAEEGWKVISLPAIAESGDLLGRAEGAALWPERYPLEALQKTRAQVGSQAWLSLYQCRPVPEGGAIFREEWFGSYREAPGFRRIVTAWDTSFGKGGRGDDYSAAVTIGETRGGFHILDVTRGRWTFPELRRRMIGQAERFRPAAILIEDTGAGTSVLQELRGETSLPFLAVKPEGSKEVRAQLVSPRCEAGKVFLPESAPWKGTFLEELLSFPAGQHDDMVDAFVHALLWLAERGAYFDIFDPARHVIPKAEAIIKSWHPRWISMAWGYQGNAACYWHTVNECREITTYRELVTNHKTAPELARMIVEASLIRNEQGELVPETLDRFIVSESAFAQKYSMRTIADEMGDVLRKAGLPWPEKADDGSGSRISGFALLLQLLQAETGFWRIMDNCEELIASLPMLLRDDSNVEDIAPQPRQSAESCRIGLMTYLRDAKEPKEFAIYRAMTAPESEPTDRMLQRLRAERKLSKPVVIRRPNIRRWM